MWLSMYVFCIYKNPTFFTFRILASTSMQSSDPFHNSADFQNQSFHIQKGTQMNLQIYSLLIQIISMLIAITLFTYCLLKLKSFLLTFRSNIFFRKKSGKVYFIEHSQQNIDLSHRLTLRFTATTCNISSCPLEQ